MNGIFITTELEGALAGRIRTVQERHDPKLAKELPPHLTLVGSSGTGPISPDTPVAALRKAVTDSLPPPNKGRLLQFGHGHLAVEVKTLVLSGLRKGACFNSATAI